jgi:hypothetical protein
MNNTEYTKKCVLQYECFKTKNSNLKMVLTNGVFCCYDPTSDYYNCMETFNDEVMAKPNNHYYYTTNEHGFLVENK